MRAINRRFWASALAVAVVSILWPAMSQDTAHAAESNSSGKIPAFGVQFHAMWGDYSDAERIEVLDKLAAAGVKWVRIDMGWASFEEHASGRFERYHIDKADWVVDQARARGINVLATLWRTPDWANNGAGAVTPPSNADDYGRIARWAAEHFRGRVAAWEVWNEPNLDYFFNGSPADYVRLLKASYSQFKAGDPNAEVLLGGPSYNDTEWLKKVYEAGAQGYFDVMSTHPYQGVADAPPEKADDGTIWTLSHVEAVHNLMKRYGDGDKEIWFTEFGWSSHPNNGGESNWERGVTLQEQGDYLVRSIEYVAEKYPYVTRMFWYNERNRDSGAEQLDNYGILYRNLEPKPAYRALKEFNENRAQAPAEEAPAEEPVIDEPIVEPPAAELPVDGLPVEEVPVSTDPVPGDDNDEIDDDNLLSNGGFERGNKGWRARGARLRTVHGAHGGSRAGKVLPHSRSSRIFSGHALREAGDVATRGRADRSERVEAGGFFKARAGRRVKLILVEKLNGTTLARREGSVAGNGGWRALPSLALRTSGLDSRLILKVKSTGHSARAFLVDDLWLIAR